MVVTLTAEGYAKRTPLAEFRAQKRGGRGVGSMTMKDDDVVTRLFVANTHTQLLFFTTDGMVYRLKTWQLPQGSRTTRGKALVNILPIARGTGIAAVLPVDRPEPHWDELQIVFATSAGDVRRNALSDFTNVKRNGKIAMQLPEGVALIGARIASEDDDVMLVTRQGRAIRFPVGTLRVFSGRSSTGVRGVRLGRDDRVVSMSILRHFEATPGERVAYLKRRRAVEGLASEELAADEVEADEVEADEEDAADEESLSPERYAEMSAAEQSILTITARGLGKLASSHDYRVRGRGGLGVAATDKAMRGGPIVASFPVEHDDQIMLATSTGQSIRTRVADISFRSRIAGGVKVLDARPGEEVVSVARIADPGETGDLSAAEPPAE